jgi:hypothetical protein
MLELACNNKIDHRGYDSSDYHESRLYDAIKNNNYDFNVGIELVADQLLSNKNNKLQKIIRKIEKISKAEDITDEDGDERYELEYEMFSYVNDFVGLYKIGSLHGDDSDEFRDKLYGFLIGIESSSNNEEDEIEEPNENENDDSTLDLNEDDSDLNDE